MQSLSQLEAVYGKARSQVLRDNMDSQIYYRPTDLATAQYLEKRLGNKSAFAQSTTSHDGKETSEGQTERPIALQTAQEISQMKDHEIIGFHRHLPPFKINRVNWRHQPTLKQRRTIPAPELFVLPTIAEMPMKRIQSQTFRLSDGYIDPDMKPSEGVV